MWLPGTEVVEEKLQEVLRYNGMRKSIPIFADTSFEMGDYGSISKDVSAHRMIGRFSCNRCCVVRITGLHVALETVDYDRCKHECILVIK